MKKNNLRNFSLITLALLAGCKQEVIDLKPQTVVTPPDVTYTKGTADFTKYVAIGNSLTAGFQAGALFTEGQNNSFPLIMSKSFQAVGGSTTFNQPDINSVNGYYEVDPLDATKAWGRLILFAADGIQADAQPTPSGAPGVPAPYNTGDFPTPYTGNLPLNNFGVPGILLGQVLTPLTGNPTPGNPAYNPYYARFASSPGTSTILGDAIAAKPTFFSFDLGNNDVLGYATNGGDAHIVPLTDQNTFAGEYNVAITNLLAVSTVTGGVVSTIPDVSVLPYFHAVPWNAVPLSADEASQTTAALANGYNQFLLGMQQAGYIKADEVAKRTLTFVAGQNPILIVDSDLTDLTPFMSASPQTQPLLPYARARQTTSDDLVTLSAATVLGTTPTGYPATAIFGVSLPIADKYVLVPSEIDSVKTYTTAFNAAIKTIGDGSSKIAVADVYSAFNSLATNGIYIQNGVSITPDFAPPTGGFSEDGVHPNSRGYAFLANVFIGAIETKFGATIPHASLADYAGVGLPLVK